MSDIAKVDSVYS